MMVRSGASAAKVSSKRTWSFPLPVAPCDTASAPCSRAISTCRFAISGRAIEVRLPAWALAVPALISDLYSVVSRRAVVLNREKLLLMKQTNLLVSSARARREIGYAPAVETSTAVGETAKPMAYAYTSGMKTNR